MGPQFDRDVAIPAEVKVGVMVLVLGEATDSAKEIECRQEVLHDPTPPNLLSVRGESPVRNGSEILLDRTRAQHVLRLSIRTRKVGEGGKRFHISASAFDVTEQGHSLCVKSNTFAR